MNGKGIGAAAENVTLVWRTSGGVAPQSESAAAIFLRRALPAARQKTARPFPILLWVLIRPPMLKFWGQFGERTQVVQLAGGPINSQCLKSGGPCTLNIQFEAIANV